MKKVFWIYCQNRNNWTNKYVYSSLTEYNNFIQYQWQVANISLNWTLDARIL